jgi:hypothetical protein
MAKLTFYLSLKMNGKYIRLTPPVDLHRSDGMEYVNFDPKTVYLVDGADPIILGRASSKRENNRPNDPDTGYLKVPTGKTALGQQHALLCVRNDQVRSITPWDVPFH